MKFPFATEKCHIAWCKKLSESRVSEIEKLLNGNLTKCRCFSLVLKSRFFLDIKKEQIESFREKLNDLPRYFTKEERFSAISAGLLHF